MEEESQCVMREESSLSVTTEPASPTLQELQRELRVLNLKIYAARRSDRKKFMAEVQWAITEFGIQPHELRFPLAYNVGAAYPRSTTIRRPAERGLATVQRLSGFAARTSHSLKWYGRRSWAMRISMLRWKAHGFDGVPLFNDLHLERVGHGDALPGDLLATRPGRSPADSQP